MFKSIRKQKQESIILKYFTTFVFIYYFCYLLSNAKVRNDFVQICVIAGIMNALNTDRELLSGHGHAVSAIATLSGDRTLI